ncbi:MAG: hypothetical protein J6R29_07130 [Clostridia bacterium]|nr:hypothetical protein [Clostridia bacterium]
MKIFKIIANLIFLICATYFAYVSIDVVQTMLTEEFGGFAVLGSIAIMVYGSPAIILSIIYNVFMGVTKKYSLFDGITLALLVIAYASLLVAPLVVNSIVA